MTTFTDYWLGYSHALVSSPSFLARTIVDFLAVAILLFVILNFFNNSKGWRLIFATFIGLVLLVVSDFFALKGTHLIAQVWLIAEAVIAPIMFRDELLAIFSADGVRIEKLATGSIWLSGFLALVLAALIVVAGNGGLNETGALPDQLTVSAVNLGTGLSAQVGNDQNITITISAPQTTWKSLNAKSFSATVDTAEQGDGTYTLPVSVTSKVSGVQILNISPATVSLTIEPVIGKTVPVVVKFSGKAGNNLVPDVPTISPSSVVISGAESVIDNTTQVIAPVALNGETTAIDEKVNAQVQDATGNVISGITITPNQIEVKDNIIKPGITSTVGVQPVITGQPSSGFWVSSISTNPSVLTITGSPSVLQGVSEITTAPISVNGLSNTITTVTSNLVIPAGITLTDTSITQVSVTINLSDVSTTKTITPQINYQNIPGSLTVTGSSPSSITMVVSGSANTLASLNDGSVVVNVDLSSYLSAGTYAVSLSNNDVTTPTGIGLVSFLPSTISVTLTNK